MKINYSVSHQKSREIFIFPCKNILAYLQCKTSLDRASFPYNLTIRSSKHSVCTYPQKRVIQELVLGNRNNVFGDSAIAYGALKALMNTPIPSVPLIHN